MKVLIIEDEAPAFRRLQRCLEDIQPDISIVEVIDSVSESVKWLNSHQHPDLIFMDIQLSDGISFDIFDATDINIPVIFTTAFDEYMLRAFKVNSIDYLLKPIKSEELEQSLKKFSKLNSNNGLVPSHLGELLKNIRLDDKKYKSRFLVKKGEELYSVETEQILCFRSHHGVVHLDTVSGSSFLMDSSLDEVMQSLDPQRFYRANRQFIIHFPHIRKVHKYHKGKLLVEMVSETKDQITVSAEKATEFKNWLND